MGNPAQTQAFAAVQRRLATELAVALKRKPVAEAKLAGALRTVAAHCPILRGALADAAEVLVRRGSFGRELYACAVRSLVDARDKRGAALLKNALSADDAGGLATLSAACFSADASLAAPLARAASSRHAQLAFAADVARLARGEATGARLMALAPRIKESHRIELCVEIFVPLARAPRTTAPQTRVPVDIGPALKVLRDAERHLGRWLVLAEVATRAGDGEPLAEARERSAVGAESARAAWSLVAWALDDRSEFPATRATVELVARLSDRPSSDRDTTFLFRMARARAPTAKAMLESLVRGTPASRRAPTEGTEEPLIDEVAVRAARCLARDYGRTDLVVWLSRIAASKRDELRGLAAAALWDVGAREGAIAAADIAIASKGIGAGVWGSLVKAAGSDHAREVMSESTFRRVQLGWVE